jgi:hypothetical protein
MGCEYGMGMGMALGFGCIYHYVVTNLVALWNIRF